jgi:hypothetical protein
MSNRNNIRNGAKNVETYLEYCKELNSFLDSRENNSNRHGRQINNLEQIKNDIETIDLMYDFFDEMNAEINKYEKKNLEIEKKIERIEK